MRRINEKLYEVWETDGVDEYGQRGVPTDTGRTVRANIAARDQVIVEDNIKYVLSYHTGLTWETGLEVGQQLRFDDDIFKITSVNEDARKTQLTLEVV